MAPRPRFDEHEDPADFNPDHDVDFLNTRARHRDLVLRLKGAQGGGRDRPWRSDAGAGGGPAPTPAVERLQQRSAPPAANGATNAERKFVRPSELPSETALPSVEQIRASLPARPRASAPSSSSSIASESRLAAQARAARLRGGSAKAADSLAQIRRSQREVEEDFAERRHRAAAEERSARAADRRAAEAHRRRAAADRRAKEEAERQAAQKGREEAAEVRREAAQKAAKEEERKRRRLQVEASAEARRRKEKEEEAEAMRIWNGLREKEKANAREMGRRSQNGGGKPGVRFDRSVRNRTSSFETLETYGTAGTEASAGTATTNAFDVNFWIPSCGADFADSFADHLANGFADGGCMALAGGGGCDGWLDNLFSVAGSVGADGGTTTTGSNDNAGGGDNTGTPTKQAGSKTKASPGSPTTVMATKAPSAAAATQ